MSTIPQAWTHLRTTVLTGTASSISFQNLNDQYRRFYLVVYVVNDANAKVIRVQINGDSGSNYPYQRLTADSTSIGASRDATGATGMLMLGSVNLAASGVALFEAHISKPSAGVVARSTRAAALQGSSSAITFDTAANEWTNTSALISRLDIVTTNNFAAGTVAVLFGAP